MKHWRAGALLLATVAVFALVAHICVGPLHAHAGAVTTHEDHPSGRGDHGAADGGSCEVLKSSTALAVPVVALAFAIVDLVHEDRHGAASIVSAPPATTSPPLFLLHASLLI